MKLQNFQTLLAKIYTDELFRNDFFENPVLFAQKYDISTENLEILATQYKQEIQLFSQTLLNKRLFAIKNILPKTYFIFQENSKKNEKNKDIKFYFEKFCQKNTLFSENRYLQDAFDFGVFLRKNNFFGENLSEKQKNIIILEYLNLRTGNKPFFRFLIKKNLFFVHLYVFGKYFKIQAP